jgi:hypothetical protein
VAARWRRGCYARSIVCVAFAIGVGNGPLNAAGEWMASLAAESGRVFMIVQLALYNTQKYAQGVTHSVPESLAPETSQSCGFPPLFRYVQVLPYEHSLCS